MNEFLRKLPTLSTQGKAGWMIEWSCKCYSREKESEEKWKEMEKKEGGKGIEEKGRSRWRYGMRLRGFSPGCQPMAGLVARREDTRGRYYDVLEYDRALSDKERRDYELDLIEEG